MSKRYRIDFAYAFFSHSNKLLQVAFKLFEFIEIQIILNFGKTYFVILSISNIKIVYYCSDIILPDIPSI